MDNKQNDNQSFTDYQEVVNALQPYIDGAQKGDGKLGTSTFYDHTRVVGSIDGQIGNEDATQFAASVSGIGPSPNLQHHIAWIDISGPAAAAKVEFVDWAGFRFTDFFVLYKEEGQWKISGKVYDAHSRN